MAYVFIGLTTLVITYSNIMSDPSSETNDEGMPSFVNRYIEEEKEVEKPLPEAEEQEPQENPTQDNPPQPPAQPVAQPPAQQVAQPPQQLVAQPPQQPVAQPQQQNEQINNQNIGGKKKTKKNSKKQKQSRRTLRNKKKTKKANKNSEKKKKIHVMKGGADTDTEPEPNSDSEYSVDSSDFDDDREFKLSYYRNTYPGHYAASLGDIEGVKKYIRRGSETYIRRGRVEYIRRGRDGDRESRVNSQDVNGETMLYIAIKNENPKLVYYLLNGAKADYFDQQIHGSSILEWTAASNPGMLTDEINDIIMDRALYDGNITYEKYNQYKREGPVPGSRFGEPEPDNYSSDEG